MVDQRLPTIDKPSRSDEVIDPEQQLQVAHQVRAYFESITPKRPTKPNRSEPDPDASLNHLQAHFEPIPELRRFHDLESLSQTVLSTEGKVAVQAEFTETEYYKQLEIIDKQHHTTGTGFIKMGSGNEEGLNKERQTLSENGAEKNVGRIADYRIRSNPATNDWTPNSEVDDQCIYVSTKPGRSG